MPGNRAKGRHRKPRERDTRRTLSLLVSMFLVLVAAGLVAATDDARYLRVATIAALLGALLSTPLLRPEQSRADEESELSALRAEVARLRAEVAALSIVPQPRPAEQVTTTWHLPLVRAALAGSSNGNGHHHSQTLDLTNAAVGASASPSVTTAP